MRIAPHQPLTLNGEGLFDSRGGGVMLLNTGRARDALGTEIMFDVADTGGGPAGGEVAPNATSATSAANTNWLDALPEDAKREILELRKEAADRRIENKRLREAEQQREVEAQKAEAQRMADQQQWKELAEKYQKELEAANPKVAQADALLARIDEQNKTRIASLPTDFQAIVPTDYGPVQLSEWLDVSLPKLQTPTPPNLNGGVRGDSSKIPAVVEKPRVRL